MNENERGARQSATDRADSWLNDRVGVLVALAATLMAIGNIKDGNIGQAMARAQAKAVDAWSYYQAKSTKEVIATNTAEQLRFQLDASANPTPLNRQKLEQQIAHYSDEAHRYDREKDEVQKQAEGYEAEYERLNVFDDQFDMAEAAFTVAIAMGGITALTRHRLLLAGAAFMVAAGMLFEVAGFAGWSLHPEWLAKLLG